MPEVTIKELTTGDKDGEGLFEKLMSSVEAHLNNQWDKQRLKGTDYANVYLGSMQTVMSTAAQFILGADVADKQAHLIEQQTLTEVENTKLTTANTLNVDQQRLLTVEELNRVVAQTALIGQQLLTEVENTLLVTANTAKANAEKTLIDKKALTEIENALLVIAQVAKSNAEKILIDNKAATELKVALQIVQDTARSAAETLKVGKEENLLDKKILTEVEAALKIIGEAALLAQKKETEFAQTADTISDGLTPVAGTVGAQKALYDKQAAGFDRDAEQKLLKIMMDNWAVRKSVDGSAINPSTKMGDATIDAIITDAQNGLSA